MTSMKNEASELQGRAPLLSGVIMIVVLGAALGLLHNWVGLRSAPAFGVDWISKPPEEKVFKLDEEPETE